MRDLSKTNHPKKAAEALAALNTWQCVIAILEGGTLYAFSQKAALGVINKAKAEQQKLLSVYDRELLKAEK